MEELTIEMLQEIDGGAWTLNDYNKATSTNAYAGAVGGAVTGAITIGGAGAVPGAAASYVGGAVGLAIGNLLD
ncbi:bacteriocin [Clostridium sp. M14]|uniref:bacteriocin n=1 Tax=Clostridium sp. M14 TaxID=2716311 RepID=UPI0013EE60D4|nr:Blp family class II bacteriocin [Clostridium sp. M14]MBZ9693470.1 Blp family class II bacteriocin [Clostridium sp. M14]